MKYFLLGIIFAVFVLVFLQVDIYEKKTDGSSNVLRLSEDDTNLSLDKANNISVPEISAPNRNAELIKDNTIQKVGIQRNLAVEISDSKILDEDSALYKKLLDDYKNNSFLAKEVSETDFVIARTHPKGDIIFTLYNRNMVRFARENPEEYFQFVQRNFGELNDEGSSANNSGYLFLDALNKASRSLNIDVISTHCNKDKCFFEAIFSSADDANSLFSQLEENNNFHAIISAVFSIRENSFVATAYLN